MASSSSKPEETKSPFNLPPDLQEIIVARLPVKSILRFGLVSKRCNSIISDPAFISKQLDFKKSQFLVQDFITVIQADFSRITTKSYSIYSDDANFDNVATIEFEKPSALDYSDFVGCVNGVVCVPVHRPTSKGTDVLLWNPSIRRSLLLPRSTADLLCPLKRPCIFVFGFVYDNASRDFKVLRAYTDSAGLLPFAGYLESIKTIEMYRLSTDPGESGWENITQKASLIGTISRDSQAELNGVAHWLGTDRNNRSTLIVVTFDIHEESFGAFGLPPEGEEGCRHGDFRRRQLFAFEGKLYYFRGALNRNLPRAMLDASSSRPMGYDIWRMDKYGDSGSWEQLHRGVFDFGAVPLGFRKNGDVIWSAEGLGLVSCKIGENTVTTTFGVSAHPNYNRFEPLTIEARFIDEVALGSPYSESLVLLDRTSPSRGTEDILLNYE